MCGAAAAAADVQMMALETMIAVKFGHGLYPRPWPRAVVVGWVVAAVLFSGVLMLWQYLLVQQTQHDAAALHKKQQQQQQQQGHQNGNCKSD
jgi:hypothetical protein